MITWVLTWTALWWFVYQSWIIFGIGVAQRMQTASVPTSAGGRIWLRWCARLDLLSQVCESNVGSVIDEYVIAHVHMQNSLSCCVFKYTQPLTETTELVRQGCMASIKLKHIGAKQDHTIITFNECGRAVLDSMHLASQHWHMFYQLT